MRTPPTPQNIPVHPLSRRYQTEDGPGPNLLQQKQQSQQLELYATNTVRSEADDEGNETKDTTTNNQPLTPKVQPIKSATERLKWKFLGW